MHIYPIWPTAWTDALCIFWRSVYAPYMEFQPHLQAETNEVLLSGYYKWFFHKSARLETKQINHFIWKRRARDQNITGFDWTFKYGWDGKWNSITNTRSRDSIIYRMFWSVPGEYISARKRRRFTWFIHPECDFPAISDIALFFIVMRTEWVHDSLFQLNHLFPFFQLFSGDFWGDIYIQSKY